jgi:homoserine kinase type II
VEPKILELLPVIAETWAGCPAKSKGSVFDERIRERLDLVSDNLAATMMALGEPQVRALPEMAIHCDYHPGNLKFTGEAVTGLFDFDWSKIDLRLFDLSLALWYFCTSWQGSHQDGSFRLEWARTFLRAYQDTLAEALEAHPEATPISAVEARYLPVMINAANLYVLNWTILDYFNKDVDPQEYLVFLDHSLNFTLWYEEKWEALEEIL